RVQGRDVHDAEAQARDRLPRSILEASADVERAELRGHVVATLCRIGILITGRTVCAHAIGRERRRLLRLDQTRLQRRVALNRTRQILRPRRTELRLCRAEQPARRRNEREVLRIIACVLRRAGCEFAYPTVLA